MGITRKKHLLLRKEMFIMQEELKKEVEELKTIVMEYIRTASNLDMFIQLLEKFIEEGDDSIYIKYAIVSLYKDRIDMMRNQFSNLDEKENLHWETLIKIAEES